MSFFKESVHQQLFPAPLKRSTLSFIMILFVIDLFFIGFNILLLALKYYGLLESGILLYFSVDMEASIPEMFNYLKLLLVSSALYLTYKHSRILIYLILSLIYMVAVLDDALALHEQLSLVLASSLGLPDFLRQNTYAELLYFSIFGAIFVPVLLGAWIKAPPAHKRLSFNMLALLGTLAFFVVFVDFIHSLIASHSRIVNVAFALIEDGGEMLVVTLSCWVVLSIHRYVSLSYQSHGRT